MASGEKACRLSQREVTRLARTGPPAMSVIRSLSVGKRTWPSLLCSIKLKQTADPIDVGTAHSSCC